MNPVLVGSGFGKRVANWIGRDKVYPTNVLHLATVTKNKNHSAAFPEALPEWFIKLFTDERDWVLDPFMGSGTTLRVAYRMRRNSIGIDIMESYYQQVKAALECVQPQQWSLEELLAAVTSDNFHAEIDTGEAVGNEVL